MSHTRWKSLRERQLIEGYTESGDIVEARREIRLSMALAQAVCDRRTELGLTLTELGERAGLTHAKISRISGSDAVPTLPCPRRHPQHRPRRRRHPRQLHQPPHRRSLSSQARLVEGKVVPPIL